MTINGLVLASQLKLCRKAEFYIYIYIITFLPVIKYEKGFILYRFAILFLFFLRKTA